MSASTASHRGAHAAKSKAAPRRRSLFVFGGVALAAIVVVAGLIAFQATRGADAKIPPRVATGDGRVLGDENAPVTVVEYADFQCPVCKRAETSIISEIEKKYVQQGKVKIEFRMFPIVGQESFNAAQAAEAARDQGKFWEYHDALYNAQGRENGGNFTYEKLVALAEQVGLDIPEFEATLSGNTYLAAIQKEKDTAEANGVSSTPTFFIGEKKIVGAQPFGQFSAAIDAELARLGQ
jgi:protein-disulfide isomerase